MKLYLNRISLIDVHKKFEIDMSKIVLFFVRIVILAGFGVATAYAQNTQVVGYWFKVGSSYKYKFETRFDLKESIDGYLEWTLLDSPRESEKGKLGLKAKEFVRGRFDKNTRQLFLTGYGKEDPHGIIGTDEYRLEVSSDGRQIFGITKGNGDWSGRLESRLSAISDLDSARSRSWVKEGQHQSASASGSPANQSSGETSNNFRYKIQKNGAEVLDTTTGLTWQRCSVGQKWNGKNCRGEATSVSYFQLKLILENGKDLGGWRVPTIQELSSLIDCNSGERRLKLVDVGNPEPIKKYCHGKYNYLTVNTSIFPNTPDSNFWSSSNISRCDDCSMWSVDFFAGVASNGNIKSDSFYVRLVK